MSRERERGRWRGVQDVGILGGGEDIEIKLDEKSFGLVQCSLVYVDHTQLLPR